jgi:hypothetical protein
MDDWDSKYRPKSKVVTKTIDVDSTDVNETRGSIAVEEKKASAEPNISSQGETGLMLAADVKNHFKALPNDPDHNKVAAKYEGKDLTANDKAILAGFEALDENRTLINLADTLRDAPRVVWSKGSGGDAVNYCVPSLLVAPATAKTVKFGIKGAFAFFKSGKWSYTLEKNPQWQTSGEVVTPIIPARAIPEGGLDGLVILFEAEEKDWKRSKGELKKAPRCVNDPALLEPISGNLYRVVSTWELTAIERAALGG